MNEEEKQIVLEDEEGNEVLFDVMDTIEYEGHTYLVLLEVPDEESEEAEEEDETEVTILRLETDADGNEQYVWEEDEDTMQYVFDLYQAGIEDYDFGDAL